MVKNKIVLLTVFLFAVFSFSVFSQENSNSSRIDESSIVLSDSGNFSEETANNTPVVRTSNNGAFIGMIVIFVLVIVLLFWVLKIIKKRGNVVKTEDDFLRRAASISVGNGQTVEVVTLIDRAYVIGVTPEKITLLDEFTDENERDKDLIESMNLNADKKANTKKPVKFSEVLDMFTKKSGNTTKTTGSIYNSSENTLDNLLNRNQKKE